MGAAPASSLRVGTFGDRSSAVEMCVVSSWCGEPLPAPGPTFGARPACRDMCRACCRAPGAAFSRAAVCLGPCGYRTAGLQRWDTGGRCPVRAQGHGRGERGCSAPFVLGAAAAPWNFLRTLPLVLLPGIAQWELSAFTGKACLQDPWCLQLGLGAPCRACSKPPPTAPPQLRAPHECLWAVLAEPPPREPCAQPCCTQLLPPQPQTESWVRARAPPAQGHSCPRSRG